MLEIHCYLPHSHDPNTHKRTIIVTAEIYGSLYLTCPNTREQQNVDSHIFDTPIFLIESTGYPPCNL